MPGRKVLGPEPEEFVRAGGALPAFGWWSFGCERLQTGANMDVVAASYPQLKAHVPGIAQAKLEATGAFERLGDRAKQVIRALSTDVAGEGIDLLADVAGLVPGANLVVKYSARGIGQARQHLEKRAELAQTTDMGLKVGQARTSAAQELAATIRELSHPGLPQVVVIEDLHRMGPDLAELLDALGRPTSKQPVLVIGTAWPEGAHNCEYSRWVANATAASHLEVVPVAPLDESDLVQLVLEQAPRTNRETAALLAARMPNPHFIKLWLTSKQVKRRIGRAKGRIELGPGELDQLPASVQDVMRMRWNELPAPVRSALIRAIASRVEATLHSDADGAIPTYDPSTVAAAAELAGVGEHELVNSLQHAVTPLSWCLNENDVHWVREHMLLAPVHESITDDELGLGQDEIVRLRDATRHVLTEAITERADDNSAMPPSVHNLALAQWLLDLTPPDGTISDAVQVAALTLGVQLAAQYRYREAITLALEFFPRLCDAPLETRHAVGTWLGEDGRVKDAITEFEQLLTDHMRMLGPDAPDTLTTRSNLASWLGEDGRVKDAISQFEQLLEDFIRVLGPDAPDTLTTRNNLASWLGRDGQVKDAITQFEQLLQDRMRVLGPDAPATLTTRNNLAAVLGRDGRVKDAITQFEQLLEDFIRVLGPDAPDTLITRNNLAFMLGRDGQVKDAITQLEQLLQDRSRVLGPDAPATLTTRNNLATVLGEDGRVKDAITQFEQLLEDRMRVLGPNAPDTLTARSNLASWLGEDGQVKDAITQFEQLLQDRMQVLGPDAPDTLTTRGNLASWLGENGQVKDAITQFEQLLEDFLRVLGPDAPDTLTARGNLASWLGENGQVKDAITQFEQLLQDRTRVLGPDAPDTLTTRYNLASWLTGDGRVKDAITQFEQLLKDATRVMGTEHPLTKAVREALDRLRGDQMDG